MPPLQSAARQRWEAPRPGAGKPRSNLLRPQRAEAPLHDPAARSSRIAPRPAPACASSSSAARRYARQANGRSRDRKGLPPVLRLRRRDRWRSRRAMKRTRAPRQRCRRRRRAQVACAASALRAARVATVRSRARCSLMCPRRSSDRIGAANGRCFKVNVGSASLWGSRICPIAGIAQVNEQVTKSHRVKPFGAKTSAR